ncbi:MAG: diguanylate cyclase domain-containing protein [Planctomycetota bacterium]
MNGSCCGRRDSEALGFARDGPSAAFTHHPPRGSCSTTLSIGLAAMQPGDAPATILKRVDEKLYEAKRQGGNCTVCQVSER